MLRIRRLLVKLNKLRLFMEKGLLWNLRDCLNKACSSEFMSQGLKNAHPCLRTVGICNRYVCAAKTVIHSC